MQLHGVALEPYAGVRAGLAEGFAIDDLLVQEGIAQSAWPKADAAWKQRLAADGMDGPLLSSYRQKLAEAEDWLVRRVTPLDEDLAAWMSFLAAWSEHALPFELLAAVGLRMNDIARLQRAWARRLAQDASLQRAAAELAQKPPAPLPSITVTEAVRKPFPWSPRIPALAPSPSPTIASGAPEAALPSAAEPGRTTESGQSWLTSTAPTLDLPLGPALPFMVGAVPSPLTHASETTPQKRPALKGLEDTAPMGEGPSAPPLPFANAHPASNEATPSLPQASLPSWLTGTAPALEAPRGPALPFASPGKARPVAPTPAQPSPTPREPAPAEPRAVALPAWLTGTAPALDTPRGPALPFTPQARVTPPRTPPVPTSTPALPSPPPSLTLEQHAYLCVELAVNPARSAETLARYHQTPETKEKIDAHYREQLAADPTMRAAWNYAYQTYGAWLAARRPPSR